MEKSTHVETSLVGVFVGTMLPIVYFLTMLPIVNFLRAHAEGRKG
jgi:hypothetical protein